MIGRFGENLRPAFEKHTCGYNERQKIAEKQHGWCSTLCQQDFLHDAILPDPLTLVTKRVSVSK